MLLSLLLLLLLLLLQLLLLQLRLLLPFLLQLLLLLRLLLLLLLLVWALPMRRDLRLKAIHAQWIVYAVVFPLLFVADDCARFCSVGGDKSCFLWDVATGAVAVDWRTMLHA